MNKRFALTLLAVVGLAAFVASVQAELIWDITPGDGGTITEGAGTWANGGGNWNTGSGDTTWDNAAPDSARFGNTVGTSTYQINVDGTVKATGLTINRKFNYVPVVTEGVADGTIEMNGATFTIPVYTTTKFYTPLTTAAGLEKIVIRGNSGETARTDEFVYLYNADDFDAPIEIGEAEACAVFVYSGTASTVGSFSFAGSTAGLGGDSTKSITVFNGSTLGIRSDTITDKNIILKGGAGYGNRGNLEFYGSSYGSELQGNVTLEGDTVIETRATGKISGSLTGDYNLSITNAASNRPGAVTLTNAGNSSNSLSLSSDGGTDAVTHLILAGNYTADELVTLGLDSEATLRAGAMLTSPSVAVNNRGVLRGLGTVVGDVAVAAGGTIEGGEVDIYNPADSVSYLDVENTIGTLAVTGDVSLAGTLNVEFNSDTHAVDLLTVSGELDLAAGTINLTNLGSAASSGEPYVLATYGTLVGQSSVTVTGVVPDGYVLNFAYAGNQIALVPEPAMFALLAGLALAMAARRNR